MSERAVAYVQTLKETLPESAYAVALALAKLAHQETGIAQAPIKIILKKAKRKDRCTRIYIQYLIDRGILTRRNERAGRVKQVTFYSFPALQAPGETGGDAQALPSNVRKLPQRPSTQTAMARALLRPGADEDDIAQVLEGFDQLKTNKAAHAC